MFSRSGRQETDEEELRWAAIERLPTYDRLRKGMLTQVLDNGRVVQNEVDVTNLGIQDKKQLMESILKVAEEDNEKFLRRLRDRTDRYVLVLFFLFFLLAVVSPLVDLRLNAVDLVWIGGRVGIEIPKIEVRYDHLSVEGDVYVGSRALPTLLNVTLNTLEVNFPFFFSFFVSP